MNNKNDILQKLEELLALDNSDKEYLVDAILKNNEIKQKISERFTSIIDNIINYEDSNNLIKESFSKIVNEKMRSFIEEKMMDMESHMSDAFINAQVGIKNDIETKASDYAGKVEQELKNVLATEVATHLFHILSNKKT